MPAPVARSLVRLFRGGTFVQETADALLGRNGVEDAEAAFAHMEEAGYLAKVDLGDDGYVWWEATTLGNALAMASFGKPVRRRTADRLVAGMVERAGEYNSDPNKPLYVERLRIFGSYLDPHIDPLGDVDVELSFGMRTRDHKTISAYTRASGRYFRSFMEELMWPQRELVQYLKNRSTAVNVTLENIDHITDRSVTIYSIANDTTAVPPPDEPSSPTASQVHTGPPSRKQCPGLRPHTSETMDPMEGIAPPPGPGLMRVHVVLEDSRPPIWRVLDLHASMPLDGVHRVLQAAFGWQDTHLHRFTDLYPFERLKPVDGEIDWPLQWLPRGLVEDPIDMPEEDMTLGQLLGRGSGTAFYEYDFGDSWLHRLELLKVWPALPGGPAASLVDGARHGPPEDCGGMPGYEELLDALADPADPDHAEAREWAVEMTGSDKPFDPDAFDAATTDHAVTTAGETGAPDPGVPGV
ncbi:hypothetical protein D477_017252 [Arthrobacter crystallopoietes BAB-32]|uniref:Plasmid pRiA4b Orf3-like domain-containing protein n=1 Tax=Arthrobacter crystallopoietes BAB-32 TaxID=1246476 RepID=N1UVB3_9MICC|nr:hypothetical protein D477_017252 [Arthrobacter crystallopoietes BAB-32]